MKNFRKFQSEVNLTENTLYNTAAARDAIIKDKGAAAQALTFNFFGMLGMLNAVPDKNKSALLKFFRKDKQVRINNIGDENHDISLSVKLANDAGLWKSPAVVNQITLFLAKLKLGSITEINSTIAAQWTAGLDPSFWSSLPALYRDPLQKFHTDKGETLDLSHVAVGLKKHANKSKYAGDFKRYAKRFHGMKARAVPAAAPVQAAGSDGNSQITANQDSTTAPVTNPQADGFSATGSAPSKKPPRAGKADTWTVEAWLATKQGVAFKDRVIGSFRGTTRASRWNYMHLTVLSISADMFDVSSRSTQSTPPKIVGYEDSFASDIRSLKVPPAYKKREQQIHDWFVEQSRMFFNHYKTKESVLKNVGGDIFLPTGHFFHDISKQFHKQIRNVIYRKTLNALSAELEVWDSAFSVRAAKPTFLTQEFSRQFTDLTQIDPKHTVSASDISDYVIDNNMRKLKELTNKLSQEWLAALEKVAGDYMKYFDDKLKFVVSAVDLEGQALQAVRDTLDSDGVLSNFIDYSSIVRDIRRPLERAGLLPMPLPFVKKVLALVPSDSTMSMISFGGLISKTDLNEMVTNVSDTQTYLSDTDRPKVLEMLKQGFEKAYKKESSTTNDDTIHVLRKRLYTGTVTLKGGSSFSGISKTSDETKAFSDFIVSMITEDIKKIEDPVERIRSFSLSGIGGFSGYSGVDEDKIREVAKFAGLEGKSVVDVYKYYLEGGLVYSRNQKRINLIDSVEKGESLHQYDADLIQDFRRHFPSIVSQQHANEYIKQAFEIGTYDIYDAKPDHYSQQSRRPILRQKAIFSYGLLDDVEPEVAQHVIKHSASALKSGGQRVLFNHNVMKREINKDSKAHLKTVLSTLMFDCLGSPQEDAIDDIIEPMDTYYRTSIKNNLVGAGAFTAEVANGEIKPFMQIDSNRLKQMLKFNDIDLSQQANKLAGGKKKKYEKWSNYFKRVHTSLAANPVIGDLKVVDREITAKEGVRETKRLIDNFYAAKHGNIIPLIKKTFDIHLPSDEFEEFKKRMATEGNMGSVVPAFHGTGGMAATMILRFGFKTIKASDGSVTGRMLGDGIYFSNKIDKASQYIGNSGFGRSLGTKGYLFDMTSLLGKEGRDYQAAGVGSRGTHIRSPEWCVRDGRSQLKILRAYEVELISTSKYEEIIAQEGLNEEMLGFGSFLKEDARRSNPNSTSFVFYDGQIPYIEGGRIKYVDFEKIGKKLPFGAVLSHTANGPMITFEGTTKQISYDIRYARSMPVKLEKIYLNLLGEARQLYG